MDIKKLTLSSMFISFGVILGHLIYIPIGVSKCFPIQHTINVMSAIILGPFYSTVIAFTVSLLRNILGTGSLLAFPGSMAGALLAGVLYKTFKNKYLTMLGEVLGTGILGALAAGYMAKYIMGQEISGLFFIYPFALSTIGGTIIAFLILNIIEFTCQGKIIFRK